MPVGRYQWNIDIQYSWIITKINRWKWFLTRKPEIYLEDIHAKQLHILQQKLIPVVFPSFTIWYEAVAGKYFTNISITGNR